jgi:hypothetical protein
MKIYKVSLPESEKVESDGLRRTDYYDSIIVYARDEEHARVMFPKPYYGFCSNWEHWVFPPKFDNLIVEYIGNNSEIIEGKVILGSFNAG